MKFYKYNSGNKRWVYRSTEYSLEYFNSVKWCESINSLKWPQVALADKLITELSDKEAAYFLLTGELPKTEGDA